MRLSKILKEHLRRQAWSVPELSQRTGVPVNTIHNWLAGQTPRRMEQLRCVADCLGVTLDHLLFGIETKAREQDLHALLQSGQYEIVVRRVSTRETLRSKEES